MSSSSELSDSGMLAGHRQARAPEKSSNFSQTCSLLSQYLKEKGTLGDLNLGMTCSFDGNGMPENFRQTATMNLFPVAKKSGEVSGASTRNAVPMSRNLMSMDLFPQQSGFVSKEEVLPMKVNNSSVNKSEPETAQMTIFYAGQVIVFNDFPADKAKEIMLLAASKGSSDNPGTFASNPVQKPIEPATNLIPASSTLGPNLGNNMIQERIHRPPQPIVSDLPIARKASLSRFLEKRKDRVTARAPYQTSKLTASPPKAAESISWLGLAAQSPVQFERQL